MDSLPIIVAISFCERWSSGANAMRPLAVSDKRLWRRSCGDGALVMNPRSLKPRKMRLR